MQAENSRRMRLKKRFCGKTGSVLSMLFMTSSFFFVEIIVGYATNSMALVADSFHMLSDVLSLVIGFFALRYSKRSQRTERNTFGWQRAEVLGALVNAVFLIALCFSILVESLKRIVEPELIHNPILVLIVGVAGLLVNVIGLFLFHGHSHGHSHGGGGHEHGHSHGSPNGSDLHQNGGANGVDSKSSHSSEDESEVNSEVVPEEAENGKVHAELVSKSGSSGKNATSGAQLNMRGVYLHVLGDALGSVIVIISALIIKFASGKWTIYVDPGMSIFMVLLILKTSIPLLRESSLILLQTVPTHIKIKEVQDRLLDHVEGVLSLAGNKIIASAHITCRSPDDYMNIANKIKRFFHNEGIHSTTIQPEFVEENKKDSECVLECGQDEKLRRTEMLSWRE
ncbi:hypothetical protein OS493_036444 [Desmophyllum pertusum]|uniref:Cation efflux protein transmembrane domain-containing protein n=1 Tax=Desmophyllum pertusum TaxID=174260 RepID=A0A9X0CHU1_9CNID|nr:hypothetical protein OS493_036444 [Desmophyllum pertusum]